MIPIRLAHRALLVTCLLAPGLACAQDQVPGRVKASREIVVSAEVSGRVVSRPVPRNARVKKGAVVVEIDPTLYAIEVDRSRALLEQAAAKEEVANLELQRGEALAKGGSMNPSELDNLRATHRAAKAATAMSRAALDQAEVMLERTKLRAPAAGLVSEILPEIGESVAAGNPVFHLLTVDDLVVETFLAADQLGDLAVGRELEVRFTVPRAMKTTGRIRELAGAAGPKRTFRLVVEFPEIPPQIRAGFVARIILPSSGDGR